MAGAALGLRRRCPGCQALFHLRCLDAAGERCRPCARRERSEEREEQDELGLGERALLALFWAFLTLVCIGVVWSVIGGAIALGEAIPKLFVLFGS